MAAAVAPEAYDPRGVRYLWSPFPGFQTRALAAGEYEVLVGGSKGPGKSDLILMGATRQVDRAAYKALITRETGPQLREIVRRSHQLFPRLAYRPAWNGDGHGRWTFPSGAQIVFEAIGTVEECARAQGHEWAYIGQDEVGNVQDERVVDVLQAEIRCPDPRVVRMWRGSANPGKAGHAWIVRRFVNPCGVDGRRVLVRRVKLPNGTVARLTRRFIPGTVLDNPIYANDPLYMAQLMTLPEVLRRQLLFGDWNAGSGQALAELDERVHLIRPFRVPGHWTLWGGYDFGYAHNWVFVVFAANEDGDVFVLDCTYGRKQLVPFQAERMHGLDVPGIGSPLAHPAYLYTQTDSYPFQQGLRSRLGDATPTIADEFMKFGIVLTQGNTGRKYGLNHIRHYIAWKGIGPGGRDARPALHFFDTRNNRWLFEQLQSMTTDPADMEDVLKVNSDPDTGAGGDDGYDAFRVGMVARAPRAIGQYLAGEVQAWSPETLGYMVEQLYRDVELPFGANRVVSAYNYATIGGTQG